MPSTFPMALVERSGHRRIRPLAAADLSAVLTLSACGIGAPGGQHEDPVPATGGSSAETGASQRSVRQPRVSGLVAAVSGSTMQVQSRTDQTAVTWTGTTTFSMLVPGSLADVTPGSCVTVTPPLATTTAGGTGATGATSGAGAEISAVAVQIRPATNGSCVVTRDRPRGGARPSGTRTVAPSAKAPRTAARPRGGLGVTGQVVAVDGHRLTVQSARPAATAAATASPVTVRTTPTTTFLKLVPASASEVALGECATAFGSADQTGAVAASSVSLRPAANGACTRTLTGPGEVKPGTATTSPGASHG